MDNSLIPREQFEAAERAIINGDAASLEQFLITFKNNPEVRQWYGGVGPYAIDEKDFLEDARSIIDEKHCFNSWSEYEKFKEELNRKDSPVAQFEKAVDAIVNGDAETLKQLLQYNSGLLHARSIRRHHSTLLNYVGANGVEGFRQKTPKNALEVAEILLSAGAEVDAVGDMYRGTTTLGLVSTSIHPVQTGVQKELIDIFLKYGADPNHAVAPDYTEGLLIVACLHNGRGEAAEYLAKKNATLDLEGAAGVGDLNKVRSYFNEDDSLIEGAQPILCIKDMSVSVKYYVDMLGFTNADWGNDDFTSVNRDTAGIYLCRDAQGQPGTWVWIGVEDVAVLYEEYKASGAKIRMNPKNFPWAYEMHIEDPDGHVLRFGSEPIDNTNENE